MPISAEFQNRFIELIDEINDIKKSAVPAEIGIDYTIFSKVINYGIIPKTKILIRIADYFNISIPYLLAMTNDEVFEKSKIPTPFNQRLEELSKLTGLTYYEISQKLHLDRTNFTQWRKGRYLPSLEYLILLADFFKVSLDYLLGRTDDK